MQNRHVFIISTRKLSRSLKDRFSAVPNKIRPVQRCSEQYKGKFSAVPNKLMSRYLNCYGTSLHLYRYINNGYLTEFSANRVGTRPARGSPENSFAARSHSAITTVGMLSLNSSKIKLQRLEPRIRVKKKLSRPKKILMLGIKRA